VDLALHALQGQAAVAGAIVALRVEELGP
jgi:hypothetical protein